MAISEQTEQSCRSSASRGFEVFASVTFVLILCLSLPGIAMGRSVRRAASRKTTARRPLLEKKVQPKLDAAIRDMKRAGIRPKVTSTYRSTVEQRQLFKCAQSRNCRRRRGLYGVNKPGTSMHEAGFAVDIAGVARSHRKQRILTPEGKRVVRIMAKHGFKWRYGLKDPAHFEADPHLYGYRTLSSAIKAQQIRRPGKGALASKVASQSHHATVAVADQKRRSLRRRPVA